MVSMAAAADDDHGRHRAASPPSGPPPPPPAPAPAPPPHRRRLHGFSFPTLSWGTHRLLRCAKNPTSSPPPASPDTPSPDKEMPARPPADGAAAAGSPQRPPQRPWNLRTRRSATVAPRRAAGTAEDAPAAAPAAERALPARHADAGKRGFSVVLSKEEIAEDFALFRGTRPPRRPKKRPRTVQRQIDSMCPGFCLADVTPETYRIEER